MRLVELAKTTHAIRTVLAARGLPSEPPNVRPSRAPPDPELGELSF